MSPYEGQPACSFAGLRTIQRKPGRFFALGAPMYVKLFGSILKSSVWVGQPHHIKLMWITLLALADEEGFVWASVPGLAKEADVTLEECQEALAFFMAPDEFSRTKEHEGRRLEEVNGGWLLLNHKQYREIQTKKQMQVAARVARYRENHKGVTCNGGNAESVTGNACNATPASVSVSVSSKNTTRSSRNTAATTVPDDEPVLQIEAASKPSKRPPVWVTPIHERILDLVGHCTRSTVEKHCARYVAKFGQDMVLRAIDAYGRETPAKYKRASNLWERLGGYVDEFVPKRPEEID